MSANEKQPNADRSPKKGVSIGDFEILDEIGRGGMGVVYRARQLSLDRIVALKILAYGRGMSEQAVTRFRREAQATAKLHHPNIVPVYDQGQQDSTYYYAMELVSGTSLNDVICQLRRGEGPDVGKSRDKSPSSSDPGRTGGSSGISTEAELAETEVFERPPGGSTTTSPGRMVIENSAADSQNPAQASGFESHTDEYFDTVARQIRSVADALEYAHENGVIHRDIKPHNLLFGSGDRLCLSDFGLARLVEQPGVTQTGDFVGSPLYMSPEQISGRGGDVGAQSDIYSLGATLYEWLTLSPPFPGSTREQVISRVITEEAPAPSRINRRIPHDLETICLKAISKEPSKRYGSAKEMSKDLGRFLDRRAIKARRVGLLETMRKGISKNRAAVVVGVAAIILIAVLSSALIRKNSDSQDPGTLADVENGIGEATTLLNESGDGSDSAQDAGSQSDQSTTSINTVAANMERGEQLASMIRGPLASLLSSGDDTDDGPRTTGQRLGAKFVAKLRDSESKRLADIAPGTVSASSAKGLYLSALAEDNADKALAKLNECLELEPGYTPARLLKIWHLCRLDKNAAMLKEVESLLERDPEFAEGYLARAAARTLNGSFDSAIKDLDKAATKLGSDVRIDLLRGMALVGMGRDHDALGEMNLVLIVEPNNVLAMVTRAKSLYASKRYDHAIVDLTKVIQLEPKHVAALELRSDCYDKLGQYEEAWADILVVMEIAPSTELLMKSAPVLARRDQQRLENEREAAAAQQGKGQPNEQQAEMPDPSKEGSVKKWLEKLIDNSKNEKSELRSFQLSIP